MARTYSGLLRYNRIIQQYRTMTGANYKTAREAVLLAKVRYKDSWYEKNFYEKLETDVFFGGANLINTTSLYEYSGEKLGVLARMRDFRLVHSNDIILADKKEKQLPTEFTFSELLDKYLNDEIDYLKYKKYVNKLKDEIKSGVRLYANGD